MVATTYPSPTAAASPPPAPTPPADDPWDSADKAQWDPTFRVYGQVQANVWHCALVKGQGKVPFDPAIHPIDQRYTAVEIAIVPVIPGRQPVERSMIAESKEFAQIVNPSVKALGQGWNLKLLSERFVEAQLAPSGRKYTGTSGEQVDATTIKFTRVFQSEDECLAAAQSGRGYTNGNGNGGAPAQGTPAAASATTASMEHERKFLAEKLLPAVVKQAGGDVQKLEEMLAKSPALAKHFTISSPEVLALLGGEALPF